MNYLKQRTRTRQQLLLYPHFLKLTPIYNLYNLHFIKTLPNATVQQSLLASPSAGSMVATALPFRRGSQTFTLPAREK